MRARNGSRSACRSMCWLLLFLFGSEGAAAQLCVPASRDTHEFPVVNGNCLERGATHVSDGGASIGLNGTTKRIKGAGDAAERSGEPVRLRPAQQAISAERAASSFDQDEAALNRLKILASQSMPSRFDPDMWTRLLGDMVSVTKRPKPGEAELRIPPIHMRHEHQTMSLRMLKRPSESTEALIHLLVIAQDTLARSVTLNDEILKPGARPESRTGTTVNRRAHSVLQAPSNDSRLVRKRARWLVGVPRLNVRRGPAVDATVIVTLKRGRQVVEIERFDGWILAGIPVANTIGWVYAQHLRPARLATKVREADTNRGQPLWVDAHHVRLRAGAGVNHSVIAELTPDEMLLELTNAGDWVEVQSAFNGLQGWVFRPLLRDTPDAETSGVLPATRNVSNRERWVVLEKAVEVKRKPRKDAETLETLERGTEVDALMSQGAWLRVTAPGGEELGWVEATGLELARVVAAGAAVFIERLKGSRAALSTTQGQCSPLRLCKAPYTIGSAGFGRTRSR